MEDKEEEKERNIGMKYKGIMGLKRTELSHQEQKKAKERTGV